MLVLVKGIRVITSVRGLAVLVVLVVVLSVGLLLDRRGGTAPTDRAVVPGFDPAHVVGLAWSARGGTGQPIHVTRDAHGTWQLPGARGDLDQRRLDDVITSLHSARWHRRAEAARAGAIQRTLSIEGRGGAHELGLGEHLAGTDQAWLVIDGHAVLVDGWLASVLDPDPLALRAPFPFAVASGAHQIRATLATGEVVDVRSGPWRDHDGVVAPALVDTSTAALSRVRLTGLAAAPSPSSPSGEASRSPTTTLTFDDGTPLVVGGTCASSPTSVAVGALGACIDAAAWQDVVFALGALARPPSEVLDRRPAGFAIDHVDLPGGTLALTKRPRLTIAGAARLADPDRVAELVAALAEPGEPTPVPLGPPAVTLTIAPIHGDPITLDVFAAAGVRGTPSVGTAGAAVHRRGEPIALRITAAARAILARPALDLLDTERWSEDASTISELALDGVHYRRGAVIGEWMRLPARSVAVDGALVEALALAAAKLRAPARTGPVTTHHHLAITFAPPVGAAVTRALDLGDAGPEGCAATLDGEFVTAPLSLCTAIAAVAAR